MAQINFHTTPEFEKALARLMQARGIRSRSEAVRTAVEEAAKSHLEERASVVEAMWGAVARLSGARTAPSAEELQREIDDEMEAKLERLARGAWSSTLRE
jgi:Arc/MetJ-type ribon-helix-helix transcriptional regulator